MSVCASIHLSGSCIHLLLFPHFPPQACEDLFSHRQKKKKKKFQRKSHMHLCLIICFRKILWLGVNNANHSKPQALQIEHKLHSCKLHKRKHLKSTGFTVAFNNHIFTLNKSTRFLLVTCINNVTSSSPIISYLWTLYG